jgi:hypothetical protein
MFNKFFNFSNRQNVVDVVFFLSDFLTLPYFPELFLLYNIGTACMTNIPLPDYNNSKSLFSFFCRWVFRYSITFSLSEPSSDIEIIRSAISLGEKPQIKPLTLSVI